MKLSRILAIAKKELFHLLRDRLSLTVAILLPVVIVSTLGAAIEFNVQDLKLAVYDGDKTMASRRLVETFTSSGYFTALDAPTPADAVSKIRTDQARAALIVEPRFEYDVRSGRGATAQVLIDGSDNATVGPIAGYISTIQTLVSKRLSDAARPPAISIATRFFFNPELRTRWYIVPGLAAMVLAILSILLTSLTVAKEWESGSMELLLSTPVRPVEIIIGKVLPYLGLGFIAVAFIYLTARLAFGVPFEGSHIIFLVGCFLFLAACFAQGILISVATRIQQVAMQAALMSGLMPSLLLSGFLYPLRNMPAAFQYGTSALAVRWFMEISRISFLRENSFLAVQTAFAALTVITVVMVGLAVVRFKTDLEP